MLCASCGREVPAGDRFCEWCGKPLAVQAAASRRPALAWAAAIVAVVVVLAGLGTLALKRRAASATSTPAVASAAGSTPSMSPASSSTGQAVVPNDSAYAKGSAALDRLEGAAQVLNAKIDHSAFEIDALAAKLGSDPASSFRFVRDQIRFEPYPGVLRGALGTLICRAGNSLDRSLLLAALLQKSGLSVRIAHGSLDAQQAAALVARVFEPVKPLPPVAPALDSLLPALAQAVGATPETLRRFQQQDSVRGVAAAAQRWTYVDGETTSLSGLLAKSGAGPSAIVPRDRLIAEASDHYWVQYQSSAGTWVDLDPAFVAAEPGKAFATGATTFAPDSIPDDTYHRLRVRMTLRVAQVADGADGEVHDRVLLDHELRIADHQGLGITLVNAPQPTLDPAGGASLTDALGAVKTFQTALQVGDQVISGLSFDLAGQLSGGVATPEGADLKQAGGIGGTVGGWPAASTER